MFPVVGRVCRTRCCDVVVSVPILLTCSGDEEGEWIDFETGIIYILKNFLYIMKNFPYLLKKTIFKQGLPKQKKVDTFLYIIRPRVAYPVLEMVRFRRSSSFCDSCGWVVLTTD